MLAKLSCGEKAYSLKINNQKTYKIVIKVDKPIVLLLTILLSVKQSTYTEFVLSAVLVQQFGIIFRNI